MTSSRDKLLKGLFTLKITNKKVYRTERIFNSKLAFPTQTFPTLEHPLCRNTMGFSSQDLDFTAYPPEAKKLKSMKIAKTQLRTTDRFKISPGKCEYRVVCDTWCPADFNFLDILGPNTKLHITTLPPEIHLKIFDLFDNDQSSAACLGITCKKFYPLFHARHKKVPLLLYRWKKGQNFLFDGLNVLAQKLDA